jgi:hypothetical protein
MSERTALFSDLRQLGADAFEAAIVLSVVDEMTVIELSAKTAYLHEPRGKGGEWIGTPGAGLDRAASGKVARRAQARMAKKRAIAARHPVMPMIGAPATAPVPPPDNTAHSRAFISHVKTSEQEHEQFRQNLEAKSQAILAETAKKLDAQHQEHVKLLMNTVKENNAKLAKEADTESKHAARQKAAVEGSVAVGSLVAGLVEAKLGAPGIMALATTAVGPAVQVLVEWKKRL